MSSSDRGRYLSFSRSTLHPLIALAIPLFFLLSLAQILVAVAGGIFRPTVLMTALLLLAGLEEVIVGNILYRERIGGWERVREIVFLMAAVFLLVYLTRPGSYRQRWEAMLSLRVIYVLLMVFFQWLMTVRIHSTLRAREILLASLQGKEGQRLKRALRANAEIASVSYASLRRVRSLILFLQVVVFAVLLLFYLFRVPVTAALVAAALAHGVLGLLFVFVINAAGQDQLLFAEGVTVSSTYQRRRFVFAFALIAAALLLVLLFARSTSLLPLSVFQPLLDWLAGLFNARDPGIERIPEFTPSPMRRDLSEMLRDMETEPNVLFEILRMLIAVMARIIVLALVLLFLYYLLWPLLSSYFRAFLRSIHPLKVLGRRLLALAGFLAAFFRDLWRWMRHPDERDARLEPRGARRERRLLRRIRRPGLRKRLELGRVLKAFVQLARWADRRGVPYRRHIAPLEYAREVSRVAPEHEGDLRRSMELMEEALYSPRMLSREKMRLYLELIREVVRR